MARNRIGSTLKAAMAGSVEEEEARIAEERARSQSSSTYMSNPAIERAKEAFKSEDRNATRLIPTNQIRMSPISDRMDPSDDLEDLIESIRTHGQKVPILVRRLPDGELEVVYGRRRLLACRALKIDVRAALMDLDDVSALVAQGVENAQRLDNSYIERALFVTQVYDANFDLSKVEPEKFPGDTPIERQEAIRVFLLNAIRVEATQASRMRGIVGSIPLPLIRRIGPAHGVGRRPWEELRKLVTERSDLSEQQLLDLVRTDLPSPDRLPDLIERLKPARAPSPSVPSKHLNGRLSADLSGKRLTLRVSSARDAHLLALIEERLPEIIAEIFSSEKEVK